MRRLRVVLRLFVLAGLVAAEQLGERGNLRRERSSPLAGYPDPGARPLANVALPYLDQAGVLEHGQVPGQVAGRQVERLAQIAEVRAVCLSGNRQDPEPMPL